MRLWRHGIRRHLFFPRTKRLLRQTRRKHAARIASSDPCRPHDPTRSAPYGPRRTILPTQHAASPANQHRRRSAAITPLTCRRWTGEPLCAPTRQTGTTVCRFASPPLFCSVAENETQPLLVGISRNLRLRHLRTGTMQTRTTKAATMREPFCSGASDLAEAKRRQEADETPERGTAHRASWRVLTENRHSIRSAFSPARYIAFVSPSRTTLKGRRFKRASLLPFCDSGFPSKPATNDRFPRATAAQKPGRRRHSFRRLMSRITHTLRMAAPR